MLAPIIALSHTGGSESANAVLDAGADDYIVKPFHLSELAARLEAVIRRDKRTFGSNQLQVNDFILNLDNNCVSSLDKSVFLTTSEAKVMQCLLKYAPEVVGRKCFFEQVWGIDDSHASNRLDVYIRRIRRKLKSHDIAFTIQTVHGQGYKVPK